jgi:predicted MPP superfamily phosphohydrolase
VLKNPLKYLQSDDGERTYGEELPWHNLVSMLESRGWINLNNTEVELEIDGVKVQIKGVDDPHLNKDDFTTIASSYKSVDLKLAIAHAPYLRVLNQFTDLGAEYILAGHTHGGQLRLPGFGALVTNCDLDRKRARGLHPHVSPSGKTSVINISAGLGTNPFTPIRFNCRPEAVMLTIGIDG